MNDDVKYIATKSELDGIASTIIDRAELDLSTLTFPEEFKNVVNNNLMKIPTTNINITTTSQVDVLNYATAQVNDASLVPANIITGATILGVVGNAIVPTGTITVTSNGTYDVTNYATSQVSIPTYEWEF